MAERKPKFLRALSKALGLPPSITDQDVVPYVSQQEAATGIARKRRTSLETSVKQEQYGKRTFPTATASGYATPTYRPASEIIQRTRTADRQMSEPFFRDPETWVVDRRTSSKNAHSMPAQPALPNPNYWPGTVAKSRVDLGPGDDTVGISDASGAAAKQRHFELMKRRDMKLGEPKDRGFIAKLIHSLLN